MLLISEDLDELFSLADRIAVLNGGRVMGIVDIDVATREQIGLMMAGQADGLTVHAIRMDILYPVGSGLLLLVAGCICGRDYMMMKFLARTDAPRPSPAFMMLHFVLMATVPLAGILGGTAVLRPRSGRAGYPRDRLRRGRSLAGRVCDAVRQHAGAGT